MYSNPGPPCSAVVVTHSFAKGGLGTLIDRETDT